LYDYLPQLSQCPQRQLAVGVSNPKAFNKNCHRHFLVVRYSLICLAACNCVSGGFPDFEEIA